MVVIMGHHTLNNLQTVWCHTPRPPCNPPPLMSGRPPPPGGWGDCTTQW